MFWCKDKLHHKKPIQLTVVILVAAFMIVTSVTANATLTSKAGAGNERPNVILVVVDDQRWDEFGAGGHPYLETPNIDRLAREGIQFTKAYTVSPLCSPNRASILTGQYISRHGIIDNLARNEASRRLNLFAKDLQEVGYRTAHVGKWHMGNDASPRPGYDYWVSYAGQGRSINPKLYENGNPPKVVKGYMTDVLTDRALDFLRDKDERPFFLYIGHKAIHPEVKQHDDSSVDLSYGSKYIPADRHANQYNDKIYPRRKNAIDSANSIKDKYVIRNALSMKNSKEITQSFQSILDPGTSEETIRRRAEMLLAVDEGLGRIFEELEAQDILDTTAVILTSDNGYFYGEHGLSIERRLPYEEAVRVPLMVRYPPVTRSSQKNDKFALSIDIAPTILDLASADIGDHIQGTSLLTLMQDPSIPWRDSFLIEYVSYEKPMPWMIGTSYKAIRKGNYKYIHWIYQPDKNELYDLKTDPFELDNLANAPQHQMLVKKLQAELLLLTGKAVGI